EPAFAIEAEWCLLSALSRLGRSDGESAYLRLTTRPVDQSLSALPDDPQAFEVRRRAVLAGGDRLREGDDPVVTLVAVGAVVPEALAAADQLHARGVAADVVVVTSYDRLWRASQSDALGELFPPQRRTAMVTVLDGHPHTLAFLATVAGG